MTCIPLYKWLIIVFIWYISMPGCATYKCHGNKSGILIQIQSDPDAADRPSV